MCLILLENKKLRKWLLQVLLVLTPCVAYAQQMRVEDFMEVKRSVLGEDVVTDNNMAILDLYTQDADFEFSAQGMAVQATPAEGYISVSMPHKSTSLTINHPAYGKLVWKVPVKYLKRKHHYRAMLFTAGGKEEFKVKRQWVVVYTSPKTTIITIDSTTYRTMDGMIQAYLPVGNHTYKIESPFYHTQEGEITLTESERCNVEVYLNPFYSYLEVITFLPKAKISIDGKVVGEKRAGSGRIMPGDHLVEVFQNNKKIYQDTVHLLPSERKVLDFSQLTDSLGNDLLMSLQNAQSSKQEVTNQHPDTLHITAFDADSEIWVNREKVGSNQATVVLEPGVHAISSRKGNYESQTQYISVQGGENQLVKLPTPYASYGWVNVSANVIDAEVYVDNEFVGITPCILNQLPTNRKYTIEVRKDGYRSVEKRVKPVGNELITVQVNLKQK
jgi:hypothetical protein